MAVIYSMSDIHGDYDAMMDTPSLVELDSDKENKLILLGDYIDRGKDSFGVLNYVKQLEENYPEQVVVLIGNHEEMFMDWLRLNDEFKWLIQENNFNTVESFFSKEVFNAMTSEIGIENASYSKVSAYMIGKIKEHHPELLKWLFNKEQKPLFYETDRQIYVHAGICEVDESLWKQATERSEFIWKYPAETGLFYKDIIAGHISTTEIANDISCLGKVCWDQESHFFIDGDTRASSIVPLLKLILFQESIRAS